MNIAVLGAGVWGRNLVRCFHQLSPSSGLHTCCDVEKEVLESLRRDFPATRLTTDFQSVFDDPEVEAVVIATPVSTHAELADRALRAGKHVLVEKPLATSVGSGRALVECAHERGLVLMVGHLLLYHPAVSYLKSLLDRGDLGRIYYGYAHRLNLGRIRRDENALWSFGPHDVSVLLHLFGESPVEVSAQGASYLQEGVEDVGFVFLRFPSGQVAHIHLSWLDPHKERRLTLVGSQKMVVFDDTEAAEKIRIYDKGVNQAHRFSTYGEYLGLRTGDVLIPRLPAQEPLQIECRHFMDCIRDGSRPLTDGNSALRVLEVLEAAEASLRDGGRPRRLH